MILNRLIFPEGNDIRFSVSHKENGEDYKLSDGEKYYIVISDETAPDSFVLSADSHNGYFLFPNNLPYGRYLFEVGILASDGTKRIILPALDERMQPVNEMLILRRLNNG